MHFFARQLVRRVIKTGDFTVIDPDGKRHRFGDGTEPRFVLECTDKKVEREVALDPNLKFGEAYMNGTLIFREGELYPFLNYVYDNISRLPQGTSWVKLGEWARFAMRRMNQRNTLRSASANVSHHYDISNELYRLFLDEDMQYSCAYFARPDMTIDEAQLAKKQHIAAKLLLKEGQRVLDIGCGWGGMAIFLAQTFGAHVTGVTLSAEQKALGDGRIAEADLGGRVTIEKEDYRRLETSFDRIVSVGMFEHVGVGGYDEYFRRCAALLREDGVMLVHSIGRSDGPGVTNAFIAKYIFPGGYIPALSEVLPAIERSGLMITDVEILRLHYADTLAAWRKRFFARKDELGALGTQYDEEFVRMWEFYLVVSEIAFRRLGMMVFQIQLAHDQAAVPLTRDYIQETERQIAAASADKGVQAAE